MSLLAKLDRSMSPFLLFCGLWSLYLLIIIDQLDKIKLLLTIVGNEGGWSAVLRNPGGPYAAFVVLMFFLGGGALWIATKVLERKIVGIWAE